jgi:hypothetical protein
VPDHQVDITADALTWVRWNEKAAEAYPELGTVIARFDPGPRHAARAAAEWLREAGLDGESIAYLALLRDPWELVGFYALTVGEVELTGAHRKRLGLVHPIQGAVLVTQLARSARHRRAGHLLVEDAIGVASELASQAGTAVLALDPFDAATDEIWRERFGFRRSRTSLRVAGDDGRPLKRLYLPLRDQRATTGTKHQPRESTPGAPEEPEPLILGEEL